MSVVASPSPGSRLVRTAYHALGVTSVGLALAGLVLPIVPATPFLVVALWAFTRSSPALAERLRRHPRLGPVLVAWETRRAIPRPAKAAATLGLAGGGASVALTTHSLLLTGLAGVLLVAVAGYILTRPSA
ncbi:YbaN family protein [Phenylobacterium sp.]|uniref:YbaN family protein n=1 Tax=Phenylobacterium sp. TaxID=1871053 RepID=UPI002BD1E974|nr:YbaN family protein [Phenylobacterium sp.]HVI33512.1 YbaN family protein [Phenylobacterium sp.]